MDELRLAPDEIDSLNGLSSAERVALHLYTDFTSFAHDLNERMRENTEARSEAAQFIAILVAGVQKLPAFKGRAFRGVARPASGLLPPLTVGLRFAWPAFTSATRRLERTLGAQTLFVMESLTGRSLQFYAADDGEEEILFLPGSRFVVSSITSPEDETPAARLDRVVIALREID
jgi:hypothetical protein